MPNDIDFSSIRSNAIASLEGNTPEPTEVATSTTEGATGTTTPEGSTPTPTPSEVKKWKLKDAEGDFEADENDLVSGHLRMRDYTRKTQLVAEDRKAVAAERAALAEREQRINAMLSNAENVAQYYEFLTGQKLTPAQAKQVEQGLAPAGNSGANGEEVATLAEAQKLAQQQADQVKAAIEKDMLDKLARTQQWTQEQIAAAHQEAEQARTAAAYHSDIKTTIDAIATEFPLLADNYDKVELEDILCKEVMKAEPKSLEDAKKMLVGLAKERNAKLQTAFDARYQSKVVEQRKVTSNGIQPVGGSAPGPSPVKHRLGDKGLTNAAIAFMEQSQK